jgi:Tfp pilus assembly protein PilF
MTKQRRRTASSLLFLFLAAASLSHARQGRLIGKVVDTDGKPVPGVTTTTTCAEIADFRAVATTDAKGLFTVDFPRVNLSCTYSFEKAGYIPLRVAHRWTFEGTERQEFKLTPAPAGAPAQGPPPSTSNQAITAFNAGVVALRARDYATAAAKLDEALSYDPYLRQAWAAQAQVQLEQKRHREAAESADKAVALGSREEGVLRARWEAYRKLGDEAKTAKAREDYEQLGRLGEEAKRIHNEGVALAKAGDDAGALAKFKEALAVDPGFQPALLGVATSALKAGQPADAMAAAGTLLKADPANEPALRIRYNAALKLGQPDSVVEALVALAAVDRTLARDGLFKLAQTAFDADDTANARKRLLKVLEIDEGHARAHYLLGLLAMKQGSKPEANRELERFMALAPADPDVATARDALKYMKAH